MDNEPLSKWQVRGMFAFSALFFWWNHLNDNVLYAIFAWCFLLGGLADVVPRLFRALREAAKSQATVAPPTPKATQPKMNQWEINRRREAEQREREERENAELCQRERLQREAIQSDCQFWLEKSGQDALEGFLVLPARLQAAESLLDQAESQFSDGAFAPFWDSIESAANELGKFKDEVTALKENLALYRTMAEKYERTPPSFPVSREAMEKLTLSTGTVQRLQSVVGKAQRDFQFSVIFEQRKTNQLLVAGFRDLADGLRQIGSQVELSTESLFRCMDGLNAGLFEINEGVWEVAAEVGDVKAAVQGVGQGVANLEYEVSAGFRTVEARQFAAIRMLDNIQRRRRPAIFEPTPR